MVSLAEYGDLSSDGVTIQAIYSYLKEEWKTDNDLIKFPFPMVAITPEQFEYVDGWQPADIDTVYLFKDGGFAVKDSNGDSSSEFAGIITLGSLDTSDQVYYQQTEDGNAKNIHLTGAVNQCVKTYGILKDQTGISFVSATDTIASTTAMTTFFVGEVIEVVGSTSNDGTYTIATIATDNLSMTVEETGTLTDESAGATITITADARSYYKIFAREYQKLYAQSELADIGVSTLTYQAYRFPLANADDLKITNDDSTVGTQLPYTDMDITYLEGVGFDPWANATTYPANSVVSDAGRWYITALGGTSNGTGVGDDTGVTDWAAFSGERDIGGTYYAFNIIIDADVADDGNLPTAEEIYEFVQYSLRQDSDIDAGSGIVIGKTANVLLEFVGDTLVTENGVFIDDFSSTDINRIEFYDYSGTKRVFPFVSAGTINFNDNLVADSGPIYKMFFTNNDAGDDDGSDFGTAGAIIVQDNSASDIAGDVTGPQVQFTYDYDGNTQRGAGSAGTDAPVTVVSIGLDKAQYVKTTGTIGRSNSNSFSLVASLERNYSNPV
jgi:hypothetical protein